MQQIVIDISEATSLRTRMGIRRRVAIRAIGPRLEREDFSFYMQTIKRIAQRTPAGTRFSGYHASPQEPAASWLTDVDALAPIVSAFQARGWQVALDEAAKDAIVGSIAVLEERKDRVEQEHNASSAYAEQAIERVSATLAKRGHSLFAFQREGIKHLCSVPASQATLLADEMGLGKTLQTIAAIKSRALVICPAVAKGVWRREINTYRPDLHVEVISGRGNFRWPREGEVVIINYDILPAAPKGKTASGFDLLYTQTSVNEAPEGCDLVLDEAHALKSNKANRTLNVRSLRASVKRNNGRTYVLTATPMLNRPSELWSILTTAGLHKAAFDSWENFMRLFGGRKTRFAIEWRGPSAEGSIEIGTRLERVMLRRLRANVTDLPRKVQQIVPVELSPACARAADKFLAELTAMGASIEDVLEGRIAAAFERISAIRATLASAKIDAMIEEVESYEGAGEPVVVFSAHRAPIDLFATREGWRVITGETSPEERTEIQDLFQDGALRGVACTIKAGGVAITLTRANHAIFVDQEWTPALNAQAEDRVLRIGQTRTVTIKKLVAEHPLDERIAELLSEKQSMINASIEQTSGKPGEVVKPYVEIPLVDLNATISALDAQKIESAAKAAQENAKKTRKHNAKRSHYAGNASEGEARIARTARETWAHYALLSLDSACDGVAQKDHVGFSVATRGAGHWLATELQATDGLLTDRAWALAIAIASHHQGQVGRMPQE